jgi:hypothetical protein
MSYVGPSDFVGGAGQRLPNLVQCGVRQIEAVDGI